MTAIVLNNIPFQLDIDALLKSLHIEADGADAEKVRSLADRAAALARPKALYREAFIESRGDDFVVAGGVKLTSRVLRVNLEDAYRVFAHVGTCGTELEEWSKSLTDVLERYWADRIKEIALGIAASAFSADLDERYRPGKTAAMNPGSLEDWPIVEQRQLFAILGDVRELIGVELTDSFLMRPIKSGSGLRFPTEVNFESCQLCDRKECPGRRAPYDEGLFDRKYRKR